MQVRSRQVWYRPCVSLVEWTHTGKGLLRCRMDLRVRPPIEHYNRGHHDRYLRGVPEIAFVAVKQ